MWIYQHSDWPNFVWGDDKIGALLADVRYRQGRLLGRMQSLGFAVEANMHTLTGEVVNTSAIEGENLNPQEVRSSIARRLGVVRGGVPAGRDVEGIVEMMLDATQQFAAPLGKARLCAWHGALFPSGFSGMRRIAVGDWRRAEHEPMQVVSGPMGREKVHFQAPPAERVAREMKAFFDWFNGDDALDPVLRAGIAHLWFITIHPFEDGNGRIARAIAEMALARADGEANRYYGMATQIAAERNDYYRKLETQQRATPEISDWLIWFLGCLGRAVDGAQQTLKCVLYKADMWDKINRRPVNDRQRRVLKRMLGDKFSGHLNTSKYAKLAKCSTDTALRDIQSLKLHGILRQNPGGGRKTSYRLAGRG